MLRPEPAVQYKRLVKRTAVSALRTVFSAEYPDPQLVDLFVSTTNPIKREHFPAIVIRFNEGVVRNAGISHQETITNKDDLVQTVRHFYFEGSIQFLLYALSPLDLDILSDSLIELLAFGGLDRLMNKFFSKIYDDIEDGYQFSIASDSINGGAETQSNLDWLPEDVLLYQSSYTVKCFGGFYSLLDKGSLNDYVDEVIAYGTPSYNQQEEELFDTIGRNNPQYGYIRGRGVISALEDFSDFPF